MTFILSIIKQKKLLILLFFLLTLISLSNSQFNSYYNINSKKCAYGREYIKGQCVLSEAPITPTNSNTNLFNIIPEASIDENGVYKYIQIKCDERIFIRGRKDCKYHKNIYNKFLLELKEKNLDSNKCKVLGGGRINKNKCEVLGGGRIDKDEMNKKIKIYGYSKRYGRVTNQHQVTKDILSKYYKNYEITWSNDGY